jgi:hypothetical protein
MLMLVIMMDRIHRYIHYQDHNHNHQFRQYDLMKQHKMTGVMNKSDEIDELQWNLLSTKYSIQTLLEDEKYTMKIKKICDLIPDFDLLFLFRGPIGPTGDGDTVTTVFVIER